MARIQRESNRRDGVDRHVTEDDTQPIACLPPEQRGSLILGIAVHFLPLIIFIAGIVAIMDDGRPLQIFDVVFLSFATNVPHVLLILYLEMKVPAYSNIPGLSRKQIASGISQVFAVGFLFGTMVVWCGFHGLMYMSSWEQHPLRWTAITCTVMANDFLNYVYHRWFCHGIWRGRLWAWFRSIHIPHHSIEVLDFLRGNQSSFLDTAVLGFQWSMPLLARCSSVDVPSTMVAYMIILQLQATHHMNFTSNIGPLQFVFVDNHNHKMHHLPWGSRVNYGACFSIWDRMFGTCYENWSIRTNYYHATRRALELPSTDQFLSQS